MWVKFEHWQCNVISVTVVVKEDKYTLLPFQKKKMYFCLSWMQYTEVNMSLYYVCHFSQFAQVQKVLFWNPNPLHTSGFKLIYTLRLLDDFLILEKKMMTIIKKIHADTWKKLTFFFLKFKSTLTDSDTLYWFLYIYRLAFASS